MSQPEMIKAISMWQPWASLWLSPAKRHETRHWATKHRGRLLVHAAKKFIKDVDPDLDEILIAQFGRDWVRDLPTGALIGIVDLEDCVPTAPLHLDLDIMSDDEASDFACGDFSAGRFGWRRGPTFLRFRNPVPLIGRQSLFSVPASAIEDAMNAVIKWETTP